MANTADDGLERLEHEALATGRGAHCLRAQPGVHICMKRMDSQVPSLCADLHGASPSRTRGAPQHNEWYRTDGTSMWVSEPQAYHICRCARPYVLCQLV